MPRVVDHASRRSHIAEAACQVIARHGIDAATLILVGDEAGCTTGAITHYFSDKDALLLAALERSIHNFNVRLDGAIEQDPLDLIGFLTQVLPVDRSRRDGTKVWYNFWSRSFSTPAFGRRQRALHDQWVGRLMERLQVLMSAGRLRNRIDVQFEAETLAALINGLAIRAVLDERRWPAHRQVVHLDSYLSTLLRPK